MTDANEEPQRVLGVAARRDGRRLQVGETEQRVLGLPIRWFRSEGNVDTRWVRHPITWLRWRVHVHRLGPYAPEYEALVGEKRK